MASVVNPAQPNLRKATLDLQEFKTAWRILVVAVLGITVSANAALLYGFGSLIVPIQNAFGWGRSELQATVTALYLGAIVGLQLVGWLNLRFGIREVTLASLSLISLAYILVIVIVPATGSIWALYLAVAFLPIAGAGCLTVTWTHILALWFSKNRGLALAIGLSGTGISAAVFPTLIAWGVEKWDWRAGFVLLGALTFFVALPVCALWFKLPGGIAKSGQTKPQKSTTAPRVTGLTYRQGLASQKFWTLNISLSLVVSAIVAMATSTIPLLQDRGFDLRTAAGIFGAFGLALISGRIVVGYLLDRLRPAYVAGAALAMPALGCFMFLAGGDAVPLLTIASFLVGFGAGAEFDIAAFLVARYFGVREYGRLFGLHLGFVTAAAASGPLIVAALYGLSESYVSTLYYSFTCFAAGAALILILGKPPAEYAPVDEAPA